MRLGLFGRVRLQATVKESRRHGLSVPILGNTEGRQQPRGVGLDASKCPGTLAVGGSLLQLPLHIPVLCGQFQAAA